MRLAAVKHFLKEFDSDPHGAIGNRDDAAPTAPGTPPKTRSAAAYA